jgi:hypothetical protein
MAEPFGLEEKVTHHLYRIWIRWRTMCTNQQVIQRDQEKKSNQEKWFRSNTQKIETQILHRGNSTLHASTWPMRLWLSEQDPTCSCAPGSWALPTTCSRKCSQEAGQTLRRCWSAPYDSQDGATLRAAPPANRLLELLEAPRHSTRIFDTKDHSAQWIDKKDHMWV